MSKKEINFKDIGDVTFVKRRRAKNMRLSIGPDGSVRVSLPYWVPYAVGVAFLEERKSWVIENKQRHAPAQLFTGDKIGKRHSITIKNSTGVNIRTSIRNNHVTVHVPADAEQSEIDAAIRRSAEKALKKEAVELLPPRLAYLAQKHGYTYRELTIRKLKSRWGSCSSTQKITLNIFLMQLPWELIDFVLLHELVHTRHLNHGQGFWNELGAMVPEPKKTQKLVRNYKPAILGG